MQMLPYIPSLAWLCSSFVLASWSALSLAAGDETGEALFEYDNGLFGPQQWGYLHDDWQLCATGSSQSPIDIQMKKMIALPAPATKLHLNYKRGGATLHFHQHNVEVEWFGDGGSALWDGKEYKLLSMHFHTPSEHTLDGERFPLEIHIVHEGKDGQLLVVAILHKYGKENLFLKEVMASWLLENGRQDHLLGDISLSSMKLGKHFYHYMGSLTTPPCNEGVTWILMKKKESISQEQIHTILGADLGQNARPQQALYERTVYRM